MGHRENKVHGVGEEPWRRKKKQEQGLWTKEQITMKERSVHGREEGKNKNFLEK